jgi:hypothetical protein
MERHLTESRPGGDGTDELPVLSEEAVLRFERAKPTAGAAGRKAGRKAARGAASAAPEIAGGAPQHPLEASIETLRATLEATESRWRALEHRLQSQDRAIAELKTALRQPEDPPRSAPPESLHAAPPNAPEAAPPEPPRQRAEAVARIPQAVPNGLDGTDERELLERIAALETYIAGRADRWREMEREVDAKSIRIAELEAELAQRISREQQLEQRLHAEGGRAESLRDKLRRMSRRLEQAAFTRADLDLEATSEREGLAGWMPSNGFGNRDDMEPLERGNAPELVCLNSDLHERYVMNKEAITIGRAPDCDIQISADFVSRQHATIRRQDADMYIEDESSTNGVYVNAERVRRKTLTHGDEITIGESRFRYVSGPASH